MNSSIKDSINDLIAKYERLRRKMGGKIRNIGEANVRKDFVDPFFKILGWEITNSEEYDAERYIRGVGYSDIVIHVQGKPVVFVEAKRFGRIQARNIRKTGGDIEIVADWTEEERQVLNYAGMVVNAKWAILTNFEKFRVFNSKTGETVLDIECPKDYLERLSELLYLTKASLTTGISERLLSRVERPEIDITFLELLKDWRLRIANMILREHPDLDLEVISKLVQRLLDRLIIIRYAEDKWILETPDQLLAAHRFWKKTKNYTELSDALNSLFVGFDRIHNSKIFQKDRMFDKVLTSMNGSVLADIIEELYDQNFRKFDANILGNTYESYLGHRLVLRDKEITLVEDDNIRKSGGVYYTRPYVVEYIVENTLGEKLKEILSRTEQLCESKRYAEMYSNFRRIFDLSILDPACGSGAFLNKSILMIFDNIDKYNELCRKANEELTSRIKKLRLQGKNGEAWKLESLRPELITENAKVLESTIYGVDLDPQASEIASVNLMLQTLKKDDKLPLILEENIVTGNSIIAHTSDEIGKFMDESLLEEILGEEWKSKWDNQKKPLKYKDAFPSAVKMNGFDVVIGNPPYINMQRMILEQTYCKKVYSDIYTGQNDILYYFIRNGIELLRNGGRLGFIVSRYFLESHYARKLRRFILENTKIDKIVDFRNIQLFGKVNVLTCIIILEKCSTRAGHTNNKVKIVKVHDWDTYEKHGDLFDLISRKQINQQYEDDHIEVFEVSQGDLTSDAWLFDNPMTARIKEKLSNPDVSDIMGDEDRWIIAKGMETGLNYSRTQTHANGQKMGVFVLTSREIHDLGIETELLRKLVKGQDIHSYAVDYDDTLFLLYINSEDEIDKYSNAKRHLERFIKELTCIHMPECDIGQQRDCMSNCPHRDENGKFPRGRYDWQNGRIEWYSMSTQRNKRLFDSMGEKLFVPSYSKRHVFGYDPGHPTGGFYGMTDTYIVVQKEGVNLDVNFLLGVLNSRVVEWFHRNTAKLKRDGYFEYVKGPLSKIPIPRIDFDDSEQSRAYKEIVTQVKHITKYRRYASNTKNAFRRQLNAKSYNLARLRDYLYRSEYDLDIEPLIDFNRECELTGLEVTLDKNSIVLKAKIGDQDSYVFWANLISNNLDLKYFLYYSLIKYIEDNENRRIWGTGKIVDLLLDLRIPKFIPNNDLNQREIMNYMSEFKKHNILYNISYLARSTSNAQERIDERLYQLLHLEQEEVRFVKAS